MKFLNTQQKHTLENFMDSYKQQLKNPFMTSTNINKSMEVTFFNIDELTSALNSIKDNDCAPLQFSPSRLRGISYHSPVASAQVKSCILLAGLYADA